MPKGYPPSVFVSSTCYDLNQVRADMKRFFENQGLDPILSEMSSFPVSPQIGPIENCVQAVKERADIFVLIVGTRYGSQNASGKSITNLEYLEAKAKCIPVYVFVLREILTLLPIWKQNPQADYARTVDTPKLFEFVETLRASQDHWVFEFSEAQHIIDALRRQLAYLFMEGILLRERVKSVRLPATLVNLNGEPLSLLLERPPGWEHRLFSSVLSAEMETDSELKWDLNYGLNIGPVTVLTDLLQMTDWVQTKLHQIGTLVNCATLIMNEVIQEGLGPLGVAGNPEKLVYCARRIATIRKELVKWSIEFRCTKVDPKCERLLFLISEMSRDVVEQLESIPSKMDSELTKALEAHRRGENYTGEVNLTLTISYGNELAAEFDKVSKAFLK